MKNKSPNMSNIRYPVCLDTNIIISLAAFKYDNKIELRNLKASEKYDSVRDLADALKKRQIVGIVTPTVLTEIMQAAQFFDFGTLEFLRKSNLLVLTIPENQSESYLADVNRIATAYSTKINKYALKDIALAAGHNPATYAHRVFPSKKDRTTGQTILQPDALIMAEAAKLGLMLATNNTLDFIYGHRPELISKINRKLNLSPRAVPHTTPHLMRCYENNLPFPKINSEYGILVPVKSLDLCIERDAPIAKNQANWDDELSCI